MAVKLKIHIKHLFAYKPREKHGKINIAMLTDDNRYVEYQLVFKSPYLTPFVSQRIRSLFEPYKIDNASDVMVNDLIDERCPLYQYFMILRQHIGFRLGAVTIDKIVNRIHYFYLNKTATKAKLNFVWKKTIAKGNCPWITQAVDYQVQNKGKVTAFCIKALRLAMLYMVVKNHMYAVWLRSKNKALRQKMDSNDRSKEDDVFRE